MGGAVVMDQVSECADQAADAIVVWRWSEAWWLATWARRIFLYSGVREPPLRAERIISRRSATCLVKLSCHTKHLDAF